MKNWELYDRLIEDIPKGAKVQKVYMGQVWTVLLAEGYQGIAVTVNENDKPLKTYEELEGRPLKEVAKMVKSWDFMDATVGMAAVNAYYNREETLLDYKGDSGISTGNTFDDYTQITNGKNIAVIGHFITLEKVLKEAGKLDILERKPVEGDLPDSACEYVLPEKDFTFITGSATTNKTLPRLLELCETGKAIVIGPSTPMAPVLFEYGADELSGFILNRPGKEDISLICSGKYHLSRFGRRVRLVK